MNMAGALAEGAESDLDRDRESLSRAGRIRAGAAIAAVYARLAQAAAIQEAAEAVAGALGDVVAELASLREAPHVRKEVRR